MIRKIVTRSLLALVFLFFLTFAQVASARVFDGFFPKVCTDEPTIVFPGQVAGCWMGHGVTQLSFRIANATEASSIEFRTQTTPGAEVHYQSLENESFIYSVTYEGSSIHYHLVKAKDGTLGSGLIQIDYPDVDSHCPAGSEFFIDVFDAQMKRLDGTEVRMNEIDGGINNSDTDVGALYVFGEVYYSDGITEVPNAVVETTAINEVPFSRRWPYNDASWSRPYHISESADVLGRPTGTITIRACVPDTCGVCSDPVQFEFETPPFPFDWNGDPVEYDFILPIDPPISNPRSDINQDNKVDEQDLIILLQNWKNVTGG